MKLSKHIGMACIITALLLLVFGCTPFEREIAEEVAHEASVAEQAIEADLAGTTYHAQQGATAPSQTLPPTTTVTGPAIKQSAMDAAQDARLIVIYCDNSERREKEKRVKYWPRGFHV